jgi:hypothetical protein
MGPLVGIPIALSAGLHGALYGAWKDSPHEDFRLARFNRELVIAVVSGAALCAAAPAACALVLFLSVFAITRVTTEFYKLFLRCEAQEGFRIPTQVHCLGRVVHSHGGRLLFGAGYLGSIYGLYGLMRLPPDDTSPQVVGLLSGLTFGTALAIGGAYKDGSVEGFYWRKFLKSPVAGMLGGLLVSFHTDRLEFIVLGAIALERMFNEVVFKLMRPGYVPGKFRSMSPLFPAWLDKRRKLLMPYVATWMIVAALWIWPFLGS